MDGYRINVYNKFLKSIFKAQKAVQGIYWRHVSVRSSVVCFLQPVLLNKKPPVGGFLFFYIRFGLKPWIFVLSLPHF
jgi:hypothetical protein